ncbi:MAG: phage tail protein I [Deltaproteobacteria bacterium]|jgi:phage tail P2-like protein|nr:phage tail protein I [Deltaproteobacteria bacterium]
MPKQIPAISPEGQGRKLGESGLPDLLPSSIARDENMRMIAAAIELEIQRTVQIIPNVLLWPAISILQEPLLTHLAVMLHADLWDESWSLAAKRDFLFQQLKLHRHKGTPWAVETAVGMVYGQSRLIEWFEYDQGVFRIHDQTFKHDGRAVYNAWQGVRGCFKVELDILNVGLNTEQIKKISAMIDKYKRKSQHLDGISFVLPMVDAADCTDTQLLSVIKRPVDTRAWGYPLHNGSIRYDNGILRTHNRYLFHDGKERYAPWKPFGHTHNARLDAVSLSMRAGVEDSVCYAPRHNGTLCHDGQGRHGLLRTPALDDSATRLAVNAADAVSVADKAAISLSPRLRDKATQVHDGSTTHGQRYINIRNGLIFHNGTGLRGQHGGMNLRPARHDGLADHSGQTSHNLWGWQPGSPHAPLFTYKALSDRFDSAVFSRASDAFALDDAITVNVFRHIFHNDKYAHDGAWRYSAKEVLI